MSEISAFAVIFDKEGRVLFCHRRDHDLWNLPGGGLEAGESPWQCVIREVEEEVGLIVKIDRLAGVYHKPDKNLLVFSFVCSVVGGHLETTSEADEIKYFSLTEIPKNVSQKQVERIRDILEAPDKTLFKTQTGPSSIELIKKN